MKTKVIKLIITPILILTLTACNNIIPAKNTVPETKKSSFETITNSLTVGQLADYFIQAADDYNSNVSRVAVLEGFDETKQATRLQMFVLAHRAFGELAVPIGNSKNIAPPRVDLTGAPEWSWSALRSLSEGGVLAASDLDLSELELTSTSENADLDTPTIDKDGIDLSDIDMNNDIEDNPYQLSDIIDAPLKENSGNSKMNESVTIIDAQIVAQRFFQIFGTNLKDNFYTAINKTEMEALETPKDGSAVGGSSTAAANTDKQLHDLILEIVNSDNEYPKGSSEQKIRDFYNSVLAVKERNAEGINPLRKYLDAVDAAKNFSELNDAIAMAVQDLGNMGNSLFPMVAVVDTQDSSRKVMQLMTLTPMFSPEDYDNPNNEIIVIYRNDIISQLEAAGEGRKKQNI